MISYHVAMVARTQHGMAVRGWLWLVLAVCIHEMRYGISLLRSCLLTGWKLDRPSDTFSYQGGRGQIRRDAG